jgi:hypothetical protein
MFRRNAAQFWWRPADEWKNASNGSPGPKRCTPLGPAIFRRYAWPFPPRRRDPRFPAVADILTHHLPLLECLPAARLVLGAAGYNLSAETRTLGIPALQFPAKRLYDDQYSRLTEEPFDPRVDLVIARIRGQDAPRPAANSALSQRRRGGRDNHVGRLVRCHREAARRKNRPNGRLSSATRARSPRSTD